MKVGSGDALSRAVAASPQVKQYTEKATQLIVQSIVSNRGGTGQFRLQDDLKQNLLHYDRFDGKYVPPLAIADVQVPISGSF